MNGAFRTGLDVFLEQSPNTSTVGARFGLLMNQASVTADGQYACDAIDQRYPGQLTAILSPQHGIWGEEQANMIETGHSRYAPLDVPVFSLYSHTRSPTAEMLDAFDCLLIDLQDVGTRVYTFIWTMLGCLRSCAAAGKSVVVLDRPNPIGDTVEGPMLMPGYESFVGEHSIPLRHGLTMGELAKLLVAELHLDVELTVIPMLGWRSGMCFAETHRPWIWPSPNMPSLNTCWVYPGQVLLEGVNLSEGRGTTRPFELMGAPFLEPQRWLAELGCMEHPGLRLRPLRFRPTFDKFKGMSCGGVELQVLDPSAVRSVRTTVAAIATAALLAPEQFAWLDPPYEYEFEKPPIDILFGSPALRAYLERVWREGTIHAPDIDALVSFDLSSWQQRTRRYRLY